MKKSSGNLKKIILWFWIIACIGAIAAGIVLLPKLLKPKEVAEAVEPPVVKVEQPTISDITLFRGLTGRMEAADMVYVTPKLAGEVTEVLVKTGDMVQEGQVICKLDNKQIQSSKISLDTAAVSLKDAQNNLERMQVLYASGDISAQSFEQVENGVKMAKLQYEGAKLGYDTQVEYSSITAPISGRLESCDVEVHDMISQQSVLAVITGEGSKTVTFSVTEQVLKNLSVGEAIRIEKNGSEYAGTVIEIATMVDAASGLFKIKASVEEADTLATGTMVKLYAVSDKAEGAVTIPVDSVYYDGGDAYVYTYEAGIVHRVPVEVGIYDSKRIEIRSGLTIENQIIVTWSPELYEGAPAKVSQETAQ